MFNYLCLVISLLNLIIKKLNEVLRIKHDNNKFNLKFMNI